MPRLYDALAFCLSSLHALGLEEHLRQCDGTPAVPRFQSIIIDVRPPVVWQLGAFSHSRNVGESINNDAMYCVSDDANRQGGLLMIEVG